jgi:FlgN protein
MGLNELSTALWREREFLEMLLFKLEEEELVLTSGRTRWLGRAAREVESVLDQIRGVELGRAIEADDAAREVGIPEGASLLELAKAAPSPWNDLLRGHHAALVDVTSQIDAIAHSNREVLSQSIRDTQEALMGISATVSTYNPKGSSAQAVDVSFLFDEAL